MERFQCPILDERSDPQNPNGKIFECKILGGGELRQEAGFPITSFLCPFLQTGEAAGNCFLKNALSDERKIELYRKYGADLIELIPQRSFNINNPTKFKS